MLPVLAIRKQIVRYYNFGTFQLLELQLPLQPLVVCAISQEDSFVLQLFVVLSNDWQHLWSQYPVRKKAPSTVATQ